MKKLLSVIAALGIGTSASAVTMQEIDFTVYQGSGQVELAVCPLGSPEAYVSVMSQPSLTSNVERSFNQYVSLVLNVDNIQNGYVQVLGAYRMVSKNGVPMNSAKDLPVKGWIKTSHVCSFIEY